MHTNAVSLGKTIERARALLRRNERLSLRSLKRELELGDAGLTELIAELVDVQRVALREGSWLAWAPSPVQPRTGERRLLTVMFCDLVGSTDLSQCLDAEELSDVIHLYQQQCLESIERNVGHVAQLLGDGLLVFFGYPEAHEDDAIRAVHTALEILDGVPRLNQRVSERLPRARHEPLELRIAVHTGPVVLDAIRAGAGFPHDELAFGETMNFAARVQGKAAPGQLLISASTRRLVQGRFEIEEIGLHELRGFPKPVPLYQVLRAGRASTRIEVQRTAGLTPLVGREKVLPMLLERWELVKQGRGQQLSIRAGAGMGKSRIVYELQQRLAGESVQWFEVSCTEHNEHSAFHPAIAALERALGFEVDEAPAQRSAKLARGLDEYGLTRADLMPALADFLSLPSADSQGVRSDDPEVRRREMLRALRALASWLFGIARETPVVLVVEDLHWIDPSSAELLAELLGRVPEAPILLLVTLRTGFELPWTEALLTPCDLEPLDRSQTVAMIEAICAGRPLPDFLVEKVVERADGVPLFVEELTKAALEAPGAATSSVPMTLQGSLMARLDRLGRAKEVAQLGAVLDREFRYELLRALAGRDDATLQQDLGRLEESELLFRRGDTSEGARATYVFKHQLVRDAAYRSLLQRTRQDLHARIARELERSISERIAPESIARHFAEAGLLAEAVSYYARAGERAVERSAHLEAIAHWNRALDLLTQLPESPDRTRQEIELRIGLGAPLVATRGYASREVEETYKRARELCRERCRASGETRQRFQVLHGLSSVYEARGEIALARELGDQALEVAEGSGDLPELVVALVAAAVPIYWQGDWARVLAHLERAIACFDSARNESFIPRFGQDPRIVAGSFASLAQWHGGQCEPALRTSRLTLRFAMRSQRPFDRAYALTFAAILEHMLRRREAALEQSRRALAIAEPERFPLLIGLGHVVHGSARASLESCGEGLAEAEAGLETLAQTGTGAGTPQILGALAELYAEAGRQEHALSQLDAALAISEAKGQPYWDEELLRLKGEILLRGSGDAAEAEACLRRACELASARGAVALHLRAATSLCRCLSARGEPEAARAVLAPVTMGLRGVDTRDLRDAEALLQRIG